MVEYFIAGAAVRGGAAAVDRDKHVGRVVIRTIDSFIGIEGGIREVRDQIIFFLL